jgi:tetratricopeptide (TPR) repeat protein
MEYDWYGFQFRNGGIGGARAKFEDICYEAISKANPNVTVTKIRPNPGDGGIDFYIVLDSVDENLPTIRAYQCKFFLERIGDSQKSQIKESFRKATDERRFRITEYVFMIPLEFSNDEQSWWDKFAKNAIDDYGIPVKVIKSLEILRMGRQYSLLPSWFKEDLQKPRVGKPSPMGTLLPPSMGCKFVETARITPIAVHFGQPAKAADTHTQPLVLCGPPGIGKTRLAVEYAHQYHRSYKTQIKLPVDTLANLRNAVIRLGQDPRLAISSNPLHNKDEQYDLVVAQLLSLSPDGLLIILDNADTPEGLHATREFLRAMGGVHAIVTSQIRQWGNAFMMYEVLPLSPEAATSQFQHGLTSLKANNQDALKVAAALGYVPLAIEIASAYCQANLCSAAEYAELLEKKTKQALQFSEFQDSVDYPKSLWAALSATWDRIEQIDPWATTILVVSAFYGQSPIPISFWENQGVASNSSQFISGLRKEVSFQELLNKYGEPIPKKSIATLQKYCQVDFIDEDGLSCYSLPSLVRTALRSQYAQDSLGLAVMISQPFNSLLKHLLIDEQHPENWSLWSFLRPHVESVLSDLVTNKFVWPTVLLAERLGSWYSACGFNNKAIAVLSQVCEIEVQAWGSGSSEWSELAAFGEPNQALIFVTHTCTFARVLLKGGDFGRATSVLRLCEPLLGGLSDRIQATWLAYLGDCMVAEGELKSAEAAFSKAIDIERNRDNGSPGLELISYLRRSAALRIDIGDHESAERILRDAIHIGSNWRFAKWRRVVLGSDLISNRFLNAVNLSDDWVSCSSEDRNVEITVPRWLGHGYGKFTLELAEVLSTFSMLRLAQNRLDDARKLLDGSLAICWYRIGPMASATADKWSKRKSICTDEEKLGDSYPNWVLGVLLSEFKLIAGTAGTS